MVSGRRQTSVPEDVYSPLYSAPGALADLLTKATSAVPAEPAATNRLARNGSQEPKCLLFLAKSIKEQPN